MKSSYGYRRSLSTRSWWPFTVTSPVIAHKNSHWLVSRNLCDRIKKKNHTEALSSYLLYVLYNVLAQFRPLNSNGILYVFQFEIPSWIGPYLLQKALHFIKCVVNYLVLSTKQVQHEITLKCNSLCVSDLNVWYRYCNLKFLESLNCVYLILITLCNTEFLRDN